MALDVNGHATRVDCPLGYVYFQMIALFIIHFGVFVFSDSKEKKHQPRSSRSLTRHSLFWKSGFSTV